MLHEQVGSRAPPSKRDWPASANSPRTGVRWLASLVAPLSLVVERPEAMRFLTELRCEKLRPELFRLTERLDYQDPSADVATQSLLQGSLQHWLQDGERLNLRIAALECLFAQLSAKTTCEPVGG